jgi:hypothetical protein
VRFGRVLLELLHLAAGLVATRAIFVAAAWAYPQGRDSLEPIGWLTMGAVFVMSVPELRKAWIADRNGADRNNREEELG